MTGVNTDQHQATDLGAIGIAPIDVVTAVLAAVLVSALAFLLVRRRRGETAKITEEDRAERRRRALRRFEGANNCKADVDGDADVSGSNASGDGVDDCQEVTQEEKLQKEQKQNHELPCRVESNSSLADTSRSHVDESPGHKSMIPARTVVVAANGNVNIKAAYPASKCNRIDDDSSTDTSTNNTCRSSPRSDAALTGASRDGQVVEKTDTTAETESDPTASKRLMDKRKRQRPAPPPVQLLCEALSLVCGAQVGVEPDAGAGTWGGEGWIKRKRSPKKPSRQLGSLSPSSRIVLPLARHHPNLSHQHSIDATVEDGDTMNSGTDPTLAQLQLTTVEWTKVEVALQSIVSSSSVGENPFRECLILPSTSSLTSNHKYKCEVEVAAMWYLGTNGCATRDVIDRAILLFGSYDHDKRDGGGALLGIDRQGLGRCLSIVARYTARIVAESLDEDIARSPSTQQQRGDESSDEEEDLFTDGYADTGGARGVIRPVAPGTALDELLDLCSCPDAALVVSKRLLGDVISQSSNGPRLSQELLKRAIARLPPPDGAAETSSEAISTDLSVIARLLSNSVDIAAALSATLKQEAEIESQSGDGLNTVSGHFLERSSVLRPLLSLGGYTLPCVGFEAPRHSSSSTMAVNRFYDALKSTETFPLGAFDSSRGIDPAISKVIDEARSIMRLARNEASRVLEHCMKRGGKDNVFRWLGLLAQSNEMHVNLLQDQLFDPNEGAHDALSTRPYLMGTALAVLNMCCRNLVDKYEKDGVHAFDVRYLLSKAGALASSDERRLVVLDGRSADRASFAVPDKFSGATELFFLTHALLRVSIFPALRIGHEHYRRYRTLFNGLSELAKSEGIRSEMPEAAKRCAAALFGWNACNNDQIVMKDVTAFSILQLKFLSDISDRHDKAEEVFSLIPEHMAKLPAQYIAHVANEFQTCLTPRQGELAVQYATKLLGSGLNFSTQVQAELVRIAVSFVNAGIQRERMKQRRKHPRRRGIDNAIVDDRELDIYCSLDKNDHGVSVFASSFVSKRLGPTLVKMYTALDAVEGLDVEKDFHKSQVQGEVCELLLRLWSHPSGECRRSIASLKHEVLSNFIRSVCASIAIETDSVFQSILDIRDVLKHRVNGRPLSQIEKRTIASCSDRLPHFLRELRRHFLLLSYLSDDETIASIMGGGIAGNSSVAFDLGVMVVSLLDKFTAADGGTNPQIDFRRSLEPTAKLSSHLTSGTNLAATDDSYVIDLLDARTFARVEFGLDVSVLAHLLLGLATRWNLAAKKRGPNGAQRPAFIDAIVSHDDFSFEHWRNVFHRLIVPHAAANGGTENYDSIMMADGHTGAYVWQDRYKVPEGIGLEESVRSRKFSSCQDQFTHSNIDHIASNGEIGRFVDALEIICLEVEGRSADGKPMSMNEEEVMRLERHLLSQADHILNEDGYNKALDEWVVSSDSFTSQSAPDVIDHYFRSSAKKKSNPGLGKILVRDAWKCWKHLPRPHPNSSIFVCYSEERMDMCRALIVGPIETPYSMGVFQFDICYPQIYPSSAPMVHFMTTGGGQVRFSPNLYNDGKVCLSLLGTTNAGDESQRWNPSHSSLAQVLLSIQSQILDVAEPYWAEGGGHGGGMQMTRAGQQGSVRYNNTLRLSTLRHAVIGPLKLPAKGFEDVTRRHFTMCRSRLLVQAKVWTLEARGTEMYGKFVRAYSELLSLLSDDKLRDWQHGESANDSTTFGALPPSAEDIQALQLLDHGLYREFSSALQGKAAETTKENTGSSSAGDDDEKVPL